MAHDPTCPHPTRHHDDLQDDEHEGDQQAATLPMTAASMRAMANRSPAVRDA
jgi:hypothetical protein